MKINRKAFIPIAITIFIFVLLYIVGASISEVTIRQFISSTEPFGTVTLVFLIWLTYVFAPLGATPFYFAGFYLYGSQIILLSYVAAIIAAVTNFWIARLWGRSLVIRLVGKDSLAKVEKLTQNHGLRTLFVSRIFLGMFHDVVSYFFGLTKIKFYPYLTVSILSTIPGGLLWYYVSTKINNPAVFTIFSFIFAYVFLGSYFLWTKIAKKLSHHTPKHQLRQEPY